MRIKNILKISQPIILILCIILINTLATSVLYAQKVGRLNGVDTTSGLKVYTSGGLFEATLTPSMTIRLDDKIVTGASPVELELDDGSSITIAPNSSFLVPIEKRGNSFDLQSGSIRMRATPKSSYSVTTNKLTTSTTNGGDFGVAVDSLGSNAFSQSGEISVDNGSGDPIAVQSGFGLSDSASNPLLINQNSLDTLYQDLGFIEKDKPPKEPEKPEKPETPKEPEKPQPQTPQPQQAPQPQPQQAPQAPQPQQSVQPAQPIPYQYPSYPYMPTLPMIPMMMMPMILMPMMMMPITPSFMGYPYQQPYPYPPQQPQYPYPQQPQPQPQSYNCPEGQILYYPEGQSPGGGVPYCIVKPTQKQEKQKIETEEIDKFLEIAKKLAPLPIKKQNEELTAYNNTEQNIIRKKIDEIYNDIIIKLLPLPVKEISPKQRFAIEQVLGSSVTSDIDKQNFELDINLFINPLDLQEAKALPRPFLEPRMIETQQNEYLFLNKPNLNKQIILPYPYTKKAFQIQQYPYYLKGYPYVYSMIGSIHNQYIPYPLYGDSILQTSSDFLQQSRSLVDGIYKGYDYYSYIAKQLSKDTAITKYSLTDTAIRLTAIDNALHMGVYWTPGIYAKNIKIRFFAPLFQSDTTFTKLYQNYSGDNPWSFGFGTGTNFSILDLWKDIAQKIDFLEIGSPYQSFHLKISGKYNDEFLNDNNLTANMPININPALNRTLATKITVQHAPYFLSIFTDDISRPEIIEAKTMFRPVVYYNFGIGFNIAADINMAAKAPINTTRQSIINLQNRKPALIQAIITTQWPIIDNYTTRAMIYANVGLMSPVPLGSTSGLNLTTTIIRPNAAVTSEGPILRNFSFHAGIQGNFGLPFHYKLGVFITSGLNQLKLFNPTYKQTRLFLAQQSIEAMQQLDFTLPKSDLERLYKSYRIGANLKSTINIGKNKEVSINIEYLFSIGIHQTNIIVGDQDYLRLNVQSNNHLIPFLKFGVDFTRRNFLSLLIGKTHQPETFLNANTALSSYILLNFAGFTQNKSIPIIDDLGIYIRFGITPSITDGNYVFNSPQDTYVKMTPFFGIDIITGVHF